MDIETLVITILDRIEEANDDEADGIEFRFNRKQIKAITEAYREVEYIEMILRGV